MHSVTLDGSPKKRTLSRGISEDESLRSFIKESESSSRRLARSDSRAGTLKRRTDSQTDPDLFMGLPEMLELQASYDEVVQELRGLEVERETLLFQVDVLQDTLEGVEELLAETQREAGQTNTELVLEREAKRKLESMVSSLMQEVERLKEEKNNHPPAPVNTFVSADEPIRGHQMENDVQHLTEAAHREEKDSSLCEPCSGESRGGASEEKEKSKEADEEGNTLTKLKKMADQALAHVPTLALGNLVLQDGVLRRPYENGVEEGRDSSPDRNDSDSISAYEDASAETPEMDRIFPGDNSELPYDSENNEGCTTNSCQPNDPQNPELCVVS
ncbi:leucine-rich repeat flightless-interacting protein 1 [Notolabrus celidotus]|uniref:leucine-rich repeat flightless-interacting protein 1 n=1 Tax=Notolabrus celidotus TaxID=1203425 RepID=UPI0014900561|nr:leucine-rich repeat flightless-interacting protein 1 [Notolabrus celidotus]